MKKLKKPTKFITNFPEYSVWTVEFNKRANLLNVGTIHGLAEHDIDSPVFKEWQLVGIFTTAKAAHDYCDQIRAKS